MTTPHESFAERLLDLAYGELPPREAREVEGHAASCEACRAELLRIRETRRLMAALPEEPAPERGERILLAAAREVAERRATRRRRFPPWLLGAAAVAASLVVVAGVSYRLLAMRSPERPDGEVLLGESPYVAHAPAGPREPAAAPQETAQGPVALGDRASPFASSPVAPPRSAPPAPERKRAAPLREERPRRDFAEAPPAEGEARSADELQGRPRGVAAEGGVASAPAEEVRPPRSPPSPERAERHAAPAPSAARAEDDGAPAPALEREARPTGGARAAAKAAEAPSPAGDRTLAFAKGLRAETRSFERCEGESRRSVETDASGRVTRYVREGTIAGRRVRITHAYRPDGGLAAVTAVDLDAGGAALDAHALGITVPEQAGEARIDAPPRCGR